MHRHIARYPERAMKSTRLDSINAIDVATVSRVVLSECRHNWDA